ncbi:PREDICTED: ankyrin repeat-containing protein At3g12360-like isoform X1 [Populus euphratica]|uniref:Ankyrin repeat-containing protein At3g12360-like isoform X1 n=2 Tax=Populus euphratica TaxID=75702 RepID=A0AAJ6U488_POPEU|nr:PREDICTED: ankyrin repeat-containing protein At3g12360-like isoform X1 [Populus euphratica]
MDSYSDFTLSKVPRKMKSRPPVSHESSSKEYEMKDTAYIQYLPLYKAVDIGDLEATMKFLKEHPDGLTASISADGDTALHAAVLAGHIEIVAELVNKLEKGDLEIKNRNNATALNYAAIGGITRIAEDLVAQNEGLLTVPNQNGLIPVVVASLYGHKDMVRYLYSVSPKEELNPATNSKNGVMLLTTCIIDELYDIALDLLQHYPQLAFYQDSDKDTALDMLAQKPSAFPSGTQLALWKKWIYKCIRVPQPLASSNNHGDIERPNRGPTDRRNIVKRASDKLLVMVWKGLRFFVPAIKHMYNLKLTHGQAHAVLCCLCEQISTLHKSEFKEIGVYRAVFSAVKHGIVEFIIEMIRHYPDIIWSEDELNRGIFLYATLQRQEKIFSLIYKMGAKKNSVSTYWDKYQNNMLHQAAFIAPSSQLDRVSGAPLQMQRELQWYKEVESIVQPKYREMSNSSHKTPQTLFTEQHKKLVEEGEKWMKATAESCTVVAALIATIMFSAIFTVPGGYDQYSGIPIYLNRNSFMVFIVSDAMSLFASSASLLMFFGILTSRYREEDFLKSLPTKLIVGLSCLFFSIATMMIAFGITLVMMLRERFHWVSFPITLLASLPVTLFALLQFPLLVEIFVSTYGPGIFDKPKKWWLF